jgi:hypothetical protein
MHVMAALGVLGASAAGANADDKFRFHVSLGFPLGVVHCEPDPCRVVYREETVWETVPRTEVWYDHCGHRHERVVYERVCRTIRVPTYACGHTHHTHAHYHGHGYRGGGYRGDDDGWRGRGSGYGRGDGWRSGDNRYPQTFGMGDERRDGSAGRGMTKEVKVEHRVPISEPARPGKDARALADASTVPQGKGRPVAPSRPAGRN